MPSEIKLTVNGSMSANGALSATGTDPSYIAGNLGIGTNTPGKLLDVNGDARFCGEAFFLNSIDVHTGTASRFRNDIPLHFGTDRCFDIAYNSSSTDLELRYQDTAALSIDTACDVTVNNDLTVCGNSLVLGDSTIYGNLSVTGDFTCIETTVSTTSALSVTNTGTGPALYVCQAGVQPIAHFIDANGDDIVFADDGNVGIGTFSPSAKLEILGKQMITAGANASPQTEDYLYIGGEDLAGANAAIYIGNRGDGSGYGWRMFYEGVGSGVNNKLKFRSENLGSPVDVITMLQDGNVGIGDTTPSYKLDVNGDINSQSNILSGGVNLDTLFLTEGCQGTVTNVAGCDGITVNNGSSSACVCVDSTVVRTTGDQTIAGVKNFSGDICVGECIFHTGDSNTYLRFDADYF